MDVLEVSVTVCVKTPPDKLGMANPNFDKSIPVLGIEVIGACVLTFKL